ncbi:hypothetical protein QCD71_24135, partial [Sphingomonas sp. PsM26]|nr:hypothetical protein [Sphingomonas sp. PsM26]
RALSADNKPSKPIRINNAQAYSIQIESIYFPPFQIIIHSVKEFAYIRMTMYMNSNPRERNFHYFNTHSLNNIY